LNISWDTFRSKLDLDSEQTIIIKYLLDRLKDGFAEICSVETVDYDLSPVEYFADLKINEPELDDKMMERKFTEYFSHKKELGSGLTYFQTFQNMCLSTRKEVDRLLNEEQREKLSGLEIENIFDVDTGYNPLLDKISRQIEKSLKIKKDNINTFCSIPFEYAYVDSNGDVYPCCPSKFKLSIGDLRKDPLQAVWKSEAAAAVRKSIINRTFRYCNYEACEYLKDQTNKHRENAEAQDPRDSKTLDLSSLDTAPEIINLAYDRSCNLACPTCRNQVHRTQVSSEENTAAIHCNIFDKGLHGIKRLIISGNGDPFASPFYMKFLQEFDSAKYPELRIKIQTNGLLLDRDKWNSIEKSHSAIDWLSVSVDAATEETYKINRGGSFRKLLKNLEFVSELRKSGQIKLFFLNYVVQTNNYREMRQFIELGLKYGCDLIDFQCIENWGTYSPKEFREVAIQDKEHPEHENFINEMNAPIFANPAVCTIKLLEFLPDYIRKWMGQGNLIKYDDFGRHVKL
jgi:radical SAM protein with 4Fe4S-binding SPASM domain